MRLHLLHWTPLLLCLCAARSLNSQAHTCVAGYRVVDVERDPLLGRLLTRRINCDHPERPALLTPASQAEAAGQPLPKPIPLSLPAVAGSSSAPLVRAGDAVRAWSIEDHVRIEVEAVAEETGALGASIHARLRNTSFEGGGADQRFLATVRGTANVEMQR